ncbi:class I SAM-dependent methyltransferase [Silvanigrella aquatica]|uniref:S-adenosyl-L-methionine-dependent methyltransferase n=1 Tax=Silvanigrella aquatica TaxID=1915309 RepID=A0A1L4D274_9BACT|nr:class I SAM-dependent methyltransferase [Silvanigrella aquatica]APJ04296.1 hypothetical protein AXG55_10415 [Silvanigrella aquatica]
MKKNRPSDTAIIISKSIALASGNPHLKSIVDPKALELNFKFLESAIGWQSNLFKSSGRYSLTKFLYNFLESITLPGIQLHYLLRKLQIEKLVLEADKALNGLKQIVIIGGGADSLGIRLAEAKQNINVFEIDHPATQIIKSKAFKNYATDGIKNFYLMPVDLSKIDLQDALINTHHFSFNKKTVFVAEGVFPYLPIHVVTKTLKIMNLFPNESAQFIFTYLSPNDNGNLKLSNESKIVSFWLKIKKEPYLWGYQSKEIDNLLLELNFKPGNHYITDSLKDDYFKQNIYKYKDIPKGEIITFSRN